MSPVTIPPPRARTVFTLRGTDSLTVEVSGTLDVGAVVGFLAVADWLVGARVVTLDLSGCDALDEAGDRAVASAADQIRSAGGDVTVLW
jgi:anti-anti-sigma regulatory factor